MSSDEELHDIDESGLGYSIGEGQDGKRRKILRACDVCRRKKIRCDAHTKSVGKCTHCTTYKLDCTFVEGAKKRGPPKGYIDDLERRIQLLEDLVTRVAPQVDIEAEVGPGFTRESWLNDKNNQSRRGAGARTKSASLPRGPPTNSNQKPPQLGSPTSAAFPPRHEDAQPRTISETIRGRVPGLVSPDDSDGLVSSGDEANYPTEDGSIAKYLAGSLQKIRLGEFESRFHGKSSGVMLVQAAMNLKYEITGGMALPNKGVVKRREKFWRQNPWEWMSANSQPEWMGTIRFPPQDLGEALIETYYNTLAPIYPLVHFPTFQKYMQEGRYKTDITFACLYLLVCATASKYSTDERVCMDPEDQGQSVDWHSAGWKFFSQVMSLKRPLLAPPTLLHLQCTTLMTIFLQGSSAPHAAWLVSGIGLRYAMDVGAHRKKVYGQEYPFENEMWKRTFWCLVAIDKINSAALGRPPAVQDEDVDTDLPIEVDDEYYDEATKKWTQPPGKHSRLQFFTAFMKLIQILGYALRTIYSINKSKMSLGFVGEEWERHIVSELDSAMNKWIDALPDHLRWDANIQDPILSNQAAHLHVGYCHVQILIHRPFIPASPKKPSSLSFPSLAMCTNAARSASHLLEVQRQKRAPVMPSNVVVAFTSGIILLISMWGMKKTGGTVDTQSQTGDIHRCMKYLKFAEERWHTAGRLLDIITGLASVGDLPPPEPSPPDTTYRKREREVDEDDSPLPHHKRDETQGFTQPRRPIHSGKGRHVSLVSSPTEAPNLIPNYYPSPASSSATFAVPSPVPVPSMDAFTGLPNVSPPLPNIIPDSQLWSNAGHLPALQASYASQVIPPRLDEGPVATFNFNAWSDYALGGDPSGVPGMLDYTGTGGLGSAVSNGYSDSLAPSTYMDEWFTSVPTSAPGPAGGAAFMGGSSGAIPQPQPSTSQSGMWSTTPGQSSVLWGGFTQQWGDYPQTGSRTQSSRRS